jgi:hypothetical protein
LFSNICISIPRYQQMKAYGDVKEEEGVNEEVFEGVGKSINLG